jgi:hypothetical protein
VNIVAPRLDRLMGKISPDGRAGRGWQGTPAAANFSSPEDVSLDTESAPSNCCGNCHQLGSLEVGPSQPLMMTGQTPMKWMNTRLSRQDTSFYFVLYYSCFYFYLSRRRAVSLRTSAG